MYLIIIFAVFLPGCHTQPEDDSVISPPEHVYFSKNWKVELKFSIQDLNSGRLNIHRSRDGTFVAFLSGENGLSQSSSFDLGKSWTEPKLIFSHPGSASPVFVHGTLLGVITMDQAANGGQMYFHNRKEKGWGEAGPIRDTHWGGSYGQNFTVDSSGNIYCTWTDRRQGNPDIYFSFSIDGGETWSHDIRIDDDPSGQEQRLPRVLSTPEGILYVLWEDNRNPETLFDIYFSSSYDGGRSWSPNIKINDDTTRTWQINPAVVLDETGNLYAVWSDYRDRGAAGDVTSNLYFSRFDKDENAWSKNVRITDAQYGHHLFQKLYIEPDGRLYCLWMSSEDNQQNDIYFAYSQDGGRSWSPPTRINDDTERASHNHTSIGWLGYDSEHRGIIGWMDWRSGEPEVYIARSLNQPDTTRPERKPVGISGTSGGMILPRTFDEWDDTLLCDDFVGRPSSLWKVHSGSWVHKDRQYIGYGSRESSTFAGSETWNNYVFHGQFNLDRTVHQSAILYVRVTKDEKGVLRYYRIHNYFRRGVRVEYFDGRSLLPLANAPYPFQTNQWYAFRAVVKGKVFNYYIDDALILVSEDFTHLSRGQIGIGTEFHPTYFKDILVTALE